MGSWHWRLKTQQNRMFRVASLHCESTMARLSGQPTIPRPRLHRHFCRWGRWRSGCRAACMRGPGSQILPMHMVSRKRRVDCCIDNINASHAFISVSSRLPSTLTAAQTQCSCPLIAELASLSGPGGTPAQLLTALARVVGTSTLPYPPSPSGRRALCIHPH